MAQANNGPTPVKMAKFIKTQKESRKIIKDETLVQWFCEDLGPTWKLDNNGSNNNLKLTIPNNALPSIKTVLEKQVPLQYEEVALLVKETLRSVDHVSISVEVWHYGESRKEVWTATAHYVHQGKFVSQILFTLEETKQKAEVIENLLLEWCIFAKTVCFVTCGEYNPNLQCEIDILNGHIIFDKPHIICAASRFRLVFQECIDYLLSNEDFNTKHRNTIVSGRSKKNKEEPFCWHNQYIALQNIINTSAISEERAELDECVKILKPFIDSINWLATEQYKTLSCIIPLIVGLKYRINKYSALTNRAKGFKETLLRAIDSHFESYEDDLLATKATFIDPRFTKAALRGQPSAVEQEVIEELFELQNQENPSTSDNLSDQPEPTLSTSNNLSDENGPAISFENENPFAYLNKRFEQETASNETSMREVPLIQVPKINTKDDPFQFWEQLKNASETMQLYKMALKYLSIPATAIPVETISGELPWRKSAYEFKERRQHLDFKDIDKRLFLHSYYSRISENNTN